MFNAGPPIGPVANKDELITAMDAHGMDSAKKAAIMERFNAYMEKESKPAKKEKAKPDGVMAPFFKKIMGK